MSKHFLMNKGSEAQASWRKHTPIVSVRAQTLIFLNLLLGQSLSHGFSSIVIQIAAVIGSHATFLRGHIIGNILLLAILVSLC